MASSQHPSFPSRQFGKLPERSQFGAASLAQQREKDRVEKERREREEREEQNQLTEEQREEIKEAVCMSQ